jgi:flagellar motor switch protein FliM
MAEDQKPSATEPLGLAQTGDIIPAAGKAAERIDAQTGIGSGGTVSAEGGIKAYDFRNPTLLSETELRRVRGLYEDFARYLSARLSLHLRMDLGLTLAQLTTVSYAKFTDGLPNPTHLSLFRLDPLAGVGILDLNPRLALTIADRMLGGRGQAAKTDRHLTEIEIALVEDVIVIVLEEWCAQWKAELEIRPAIIGHENNGRFLQTSARDAVMLSLTLECTFGDCSEQIRIGVPYYTLEPLVKKMQVRKQKDAVSVPTPRRAEWQASYDGISVPVRAEWQAFEITVRELTSLRVGDVIEMQPAVCAETSVLLNGTLKFIGTVGLDTDRVAVQLTRPVPLEENIYAQPDGRKVS